MSVLRNLYSQIDDITSGILFQVENYYFSINTLYIRQITKPEKLIRISNKNKSIRGAIILEKELIPILDLRVKLGLKIKAFDDRTCFIIIKAKGRFLGVIVDKVINIITINQDDLNYNYLGDNKLNTIASAHYKSETREVLMIDPLRFC